MDHPPGNRFLFHFFRQSLITCFSYIITLASTAFFLEGPWQPARKWVRFFLLKFLHGQKAVINKHTSWRGEVEYRQPVTGFQKKKIRIKYFVDDPATLSYLVLQIINRARPIILFGYEHPKPSGFLLPAGHHETKLFERSVKSRGWNIRDLREVCWGGGGVGRYIYRPALHITKSE